jgi:hypothetical protein
LLPWGVVVDPYLMSDCPVLCFGKQAHKELLRLL